MIEAGALFKFIDLLKYINSYINLGINNSSTGFYLYKHQFQYEVALENMSIIGQLDNIENIVGPNKKNDTTSVYDVLDKIDCIFISFKDLIALKKIKKKDVVNLSDNLTINLVDGTTFAPFVDLKTPTNRPNEPESNPIKTGILEYSVYTNPGYISDLFVMPDGFCSLNINHERLASIPSKLLIKFHEGEFLTISVHPTEQQLLTKTVVILDNGNIRLVEQFLTIAYMN